MIKTNISSIAWRIGIVLILTGCNAAGAFPLPGLSSATPTITPFPTETPVPTNTSTPPPTSTPLPGVRIHLAEVALFEGDTGRAITEFQQARDAASDEETIAAGWLGIGRAYYENNNYPLALENLRTVTRSFPQTDAAAAAWFYLGEIFSALDRCTDAIPAYQSYLESRPGRIDAFVHEKLADCHMVVENYTEAINHYQQAQIAPHLGDNLTLEIKIARAYAAQGFWSIAIEKYSTIYNATTDEYRKAEMDLALGQAYLMIGDPASAYTYFQDAVNNYPRAYDSYSALLALVNTGEPVNELNRGLVDYFAGQYGVAIAAFDRYLNSIPEHDGTAHYYKAFSLRAQGQYEQAINEWKILLNDHSGDRLWANTWMEIAYTQWFYLQDYFTAAQSYLQFVAADPSNPSAPDALFNAARNYERLNNLTEAAAVWERLAQEYPASAIAFRALLMAGITRYRASDYPGALATFQRGLVLAITIEDQAAAYLWIYKTQLISGNEPEAITALQQAANLDPTDYYSERARDILLNRLPFDQSTTYNLSYDLDYERKIAETWMRTTFTIPLEINLNQLNQLSSDSRLIRAREFSILGLWQNASQEMESMRLSYAADPIASFQLLPVMLEMHMYRAAIFTSRQILTLAGLSDATTWTAPRYFNLIRFGAYYRDLVVQTAAQENINPLLIFSLIRQESFFEGYARSGVGARGLMQIIPSTGQYVVERLGWPPDYQATDLYRPIINIRLGIHYLRIQLDYFNNNFYAALAAYNGGPGNAAGWLNFAPDDPDLYLEVVRFSETRLYIMQIYTFYSLYRRLYNEGI